MEKVDERDYSRAQLPGIKVMYNVIPDAARVPRSVASLRETREPPPELDRDNPFQHYVVAVLQQLSTKLDRLIGYHERSQSGGGYSYTSEALNISGGGISLSGSFRHPTGALLDLCLLHQYGVPHAVFAIGRVCWVRELVAAGREFCYVSGVEFVDIGEDDREMIVRMVFEAEEALRTALLDGYLVERMCAPGVELVIGSTRDPQFGPMLMVGLGGIFVEVLRDVSFDSPAGTGRQFKTAFLTGLAEKFFKSTVTTRSRLASR